MYNIETLQYVCKFISLYNIMHKCKLKENKKKEKNSNKNFSSNFLSVRWKRNK